MQFICSYERHTSKGIRITIYLKRTSDFEFFIPKLIWQSALCSALSPLATSPPWTAKQAAGPCRSTARISPTTIPFHAWSHFEVPKYFIPYREYDQKRQYKFCWGYHPYFIITIIWLNARINVVSFAEAKTIPRIFAYSLRISLANKYKYF